jgi:hypothetical protein
MEELPSKGPEFAPPALTTFSAARESFIKTLPDLEDQFNSKPVSIDDVYDITDQIQESQAQTHSLRNMGRIKLYLKRLDSFTTITEKSVKLGPQYMSVLWVRCRSALQDGY